MLNFFLKISLLIYDKHMPHVWFSVINYQWYIFIQFFYIRVKKNRGITKKNQNRVDFLSFY
jgi:hypothetical protein